MQELISIVGAHGVREEALKESRPRLVESSLLEFRDQPAEAGILPRDSCALCAVDRKRNRENKRTHERLKARRDAEGGAFEVAGEITAEVTCEAARRGFLDVLRLT